MSISLLLILLFVLLLVLVFILPYNRLLFILKVTFVPILIYVALFLVNKIIPTANLFDAVGRFFSPFFSWLLDPISEISSNDYFYLSATLTFTFFCLIIILIFFIINIFTFLGANPSLSKRKLVVKKIFLSIIFVVVNYSGLFLLITQTREMFPITDGFLKPILDLVYTFGILQ